MLNRRELQPPTLPESAKPNFFDYELKYLDVERELDRAKVISIYFFLLCVILVIKPIVLLQFSRFNELSSLVYLIVLAGLFGEIYIASRKWHHNSSLSWHWLPLISLIVSIFLACTGDFLSSAFALTFALIEFAVIIIPEKYNNTVPLNKMEFFEDNLWQDMQQLGRIHDCEKYSAFRIVKTRELVKSKDVEAQYFKLWSIVFLYFIAIVCELMFVHSNILSFEMIALVLILCVVTIVILLVQVASLRFYPMFLYFLGVLAALNTYLLIDSGLFYLVVIDIFMIGAVLTLIFRYFRKYHYLRSVNFNYYDLVALLDSKDVRVAQMCFDTLKESTGLALPLSKELWLDKLIASQNKVPKS